MCRFIFWIEILILFLWIRSPCKILKPYDNPFWDFMQKAQREEREIMPSWMATRCAGARTLLGPKCQNAAYANSLIRKGQTILVVKQKLCLRKGASKGNWIHHHMHRLHVNSQDAMAESFVRTKCRQTGRSHEIQKASWQGWAKWITNRICHLHRPVARQA